MEYVKLQMLNKNLILPPKIETPTGYTIRMFKSGDEKNWARIAYEADEFDSINEASDYFYKHFDQRIEELHSCCFFCCDKSGLPIGSATAWDGEFDKIKIGMLHWVIVSQAHQGKGLCRPLVAAAIEKLCSRYKSAFLSTQTTSYKGIRIYLDMGFEPVEDDLDWKKGWQLVWDATHHHKLEKYSELL
jgi:Predicted acetyltransferase